MTEPIQISYRHLTKTFYLSPTTSSDLLQMLVRTAFRLRFKIDALVTPQKHLVPFNKLSKFLTRNNVKNFTLHAEQQQSESNIEGISYSRSRGTLTKQSGRKFPPQQSELPQQKYFVEDFQLFMSEISSKQSTQTLGILFFSNTRYARQLGKKILKDLVFEFGNVIEFYYSLYPMKSIIKEQAVGPMMMMTIFSGKQMVLERKFQENINSKPQLAKFIKLLIDSGDLQRKIKHIKSKKDLIQSQILSLSKQVSAIKDQSDEAEPTPRRRQQSHFNQISFQNSDPQFPNWFYDNEIFEDLEQGMLRYLINNKEQTFFQLCRGLELSNETKKQFNIQVIRLFCKDWINKCFEDMKPDHRKTLFESIKDRYTKLSSIIMRFKQDGNLSEMLSSIQNQINCPPAKGERLVLQVQSSEVPSAIQSRTNSPRISYLDIASGLNNALQQSGFKLRMCQDENVEQIFQKQVTLPGKQPTVHKKIMKLADYYHHARLGTGVEGIAMNEFERFEQNLKSYNKFSEEQIRRLIDLYRSGDPFVRKQLHQSLQETDIKYLKQLIKNKAYEYQILQELQSPSLSKTRRKIQKFSNFRSLITYLYNYKFINKKQSKLFVYLYTWEDINVLGAFQCYLLNQNLSQLQDTLYMIDQIYFLTKKYGVEISQVEKFSDIIEHQMSLLFTHKNVIALENRLALEKLVRAGDTTIIKMYTDYKGDKKDQFIKKINQYAEGKRVELAFFEESQRTKQKKDLADKFERMDQLQQVLSMRLTDFNTKPIMECLEMDQPIIKAICEVKQFTSDMVEFVQNLKIYAENVSKIQMNRIISQELVSMGSSESDQLGIKKLLEESSPLLKGVYEVYKETKDVQQMRDSLRRVCQKLNK